MDSNKILKQRNEGLMNKLRGVNKSVQLYLEGRFTAEEALSNIAGYDLSIGLEPTEKEVQSNG